MVRTVEKSWQKILKVRLRGHQQEMMMAFTLIIVGGAPEMTFYIQGYKSREELNLPFLCYSS